MNYINRALVKQQAKEIIRGKVFYVFLVSFIVSLLANMSVGFNVNFNYNNIKNNDFELFEDNKGGYQDFYDYYSDFGDKDDFDYDNPIEDFEFEGTASSPEITALAVNKAGGINALLGGLLGNGLKGLSFIAGIIFAPLTVTLAGMYLSLVRRKPDERFDLGKELGDIFKNSFNDTYLKKLLVVLLKNVLVFLLTLLFIVPGIIFSLSSFFAVQIMSDNPNLKPTEAIRLSKKMVAGNRTELFTLVLSFIPWYLLTIVTMGIASIYVIPYVQTTIALYYENFRMRALQSGKITIDDFKSFDEKVAGFAGVNGSNNYTGPSTGSTAYYYEPPKSEAHQTEGSYYYGNPSTDSEQNHPEQDAVPVSEDVMTAENTMDNKAETDAEAAEVSDAPAEQAEEHTVESSDANQMNQTFEDNE